MGILRKDARGECDNGKCRNDDCKEKDVVYGELRKIRANVQKTRKTARAKFETLRACLRCSGLRAGQENELVGASKEVESLFSAHFDVLEKQFRKLTNQSEAQAATAAEAAEQARNAAKAMEAESLRKQELKHQQAMREAVRKHKKNKQKMADEHGEELKEYRDEAKAMKVELASAARMIESLQKRLCSANEKLKTMADEATAASTAQEQNSTARLSELESQVSEWKRKANEEQSRRHHDSMLVKKLYRDLKQQKGTTTRIDSRIESSLQEQAKAMREAQQLREQRLSEDHQFELSEMTRKHEDELDAVRRAVDRLMCKNSDAIAGLQSDLADALQRAENAEDALAAIDTSLQPASR